MSDDIRPTADDLSRDLRADLERASDNHGPNWGRTPAAAQQAYADFCERVVEAALRRAIAAEAEVARLRAERDALARLEAWRASFPRPLTPCEIVRMSRGWLLTLATEFARPVQYVRVNGWEAGERDRGFPVSANCVYLHNGATLAECIHAALDLWARLYGEGGGA